MGVGVHRLKGGRRDGVILLGLFVYLIVLFYHFYAQKILGGSPWVCS